MYNVKLDDNNYFTGNYVEIGSIGGIDVPNLPPDMSRAIFYKWEYFDKINIVKEPVVQEDGSIIYNDVEVVSNVLDWNFDENKYQEYLILKLSNLKSEKIKEINKINKDIIYSGIDIETSLGAEHFSFTLEDQSNIKNAFDIVVATNLPVFYHSDGNACRLFSADEIKNIYFKMMIHINYSITLCNMLNTWVRRSTLEDEINSITFESVLPEDLQLLFNENMEQSSIVFNAVSQM